jgi:hypothetical protein
MSDCPEWSGDRGAAECLGTYENQRSDGSIRFLIRCEEQQARRHKDSGSHYAPPYRCGVPAYAPQKRGPSPYAIPVETTVKRLIPANTALVPTAIRTARDYRLVDVATARADHGGELGNRPTRQIVPLAFKAKRGLLIETVVLFGIWMSRIILIQLAGCSRSVAERRTDPCRGSLQLGPEYRIDVREELSSFPTKRCLWQRLSPPPRIVALLDRQPSNQQRASRGP